MEGKGAYRRHIQSNMVSSNDTSKRLLIIITAAVILLLILETGRAAWAKYSWYREKPVVIEQVRKNIAQGENLKALKLIKQHKSKEDPDLKNLEEEAMKKHLEWHANK